MMGWIQKRWNEDAGYRQLLVVAIPLILSMGSFSVLIFVDRVFLAHYSADALAAAQPAGMLNFSILCFFLGVSLYTSTFVAQYMGAKQPDKVGPSVWHGVYIGMIGGIIIPFFAPFATDIFAFIGHAPEVQKEEAAFFRILNFGAFFFLANSAFSCFYSGRGKSWPIVWMNLSMTALNIILDYLLIFGNFGFPRLGITGAGIATVISSALVMIAYLALFCRNSNHLRFQTRTSWRLQKALLLRILRFGTPSGAHFFLDIMGFTIFVLLIGRIGTLELAASNIALNINLLSLLPMIGLGTAASIMVGRFQGARQSPLAVKTTYSALHMAVIHNTVMAALYWFVPEILISPFINETSGGDIPLLESTAVSLLRYFAIIIYLDSLVIMTGGALKGAGDTKYVMTVLAVTSIFFLVIPAYVLIEILHQPASVAWICAIANLSLVALAFFLRFRSGKWQKIEVIER
jgi:MATE family multidrug resistance protein|tara:strand:+ start:2028 stop:3410 length:1383 start_codon:yes stop_codon:yes gene_type:complete